jgi:FixJ family two-component response regulator
MANDVLIVIVDDNDLFRTSLEDLVQSIGYAAVAFASAPEYLASGLVHETTCLITDLEMPEMSGSDLQDLLIAIGIDVPTIFVTASQDESIQARVLSAGAIGFLSKPFDSKRLIACISGALERRHEAWQVETETPSAPLRAVSC